MFGFAPETELYWANEIRIWSGGLAAFAAVITCFASWGQLRLTEVVSEQKAAVAAEIQRKSDEKIAAAQSEAAKANERTEILRAQNREIERALSPRSMRITSEDLDALKMVGPVNWAVGAIAGEEPQDLAKQIAPALRSIQGWSQFDAVGFEIIGMSDVTVWISDRSATAAAEGLIGLFTRAGFDAKVMHLSSRRAALLGEKSIYIEVGNKQHLTTVRSMKEQRR